MDEWNNVYNAPTVHADIVTGINKFYNLQLIRHKDGGRRAPTYTVFRRWGRVGKAGRATDCTLEDFGKDRDAAIGRPIRGHRCGWPPSVESFEKRFEGLTGVPWDDRSTKPAVAGRYKFVRLSDKSEAGGFEMDHPDHGDSKTEAADLKHEAPTELCTLDPILQQLIRLIFDRDMMRRMMENQNLDMRSMPLGQISRTQLNEAYKILRTLQSLLTGTKHEEVDETTAAEQPVEMPPAVGSLKWKAKVTAATNAFYTTIPHQFSLNQTPPLLDSTDKVHDKILMLEQLLDISVADSIVSTFQASAKLIHPFDGYYRQLQCKLEPVGLDTRDYHLVQTALHRTHGATHTGFELDVASVFKCTRQGEVDRYQEFLKTHPTETLRDRRLLWHGSRITNWVGILKCGLRIAPKEAPVTGYMFGKGVYFADVVRC